MKKIWMFVVIAVFFTAQIVKASPTDGPKGYGFLKHSVRGTLEPVEFQQALTLLFTKGSTDEQIAEFFVKIEGFSFNNMKEIYRSSFEKEFGENNISDAEMLKIIAKMKFREVGPEYWKTHSSMFIPPSTKKYNEMEWWNPTKDRPGEYIGSCVLNGVEKDLVTTYCANPVKDRVPTKTVKIPKFESPETEYVYIPGSRKVITYEPDTIEINRSKVQIERNNNVFASYSNNQSYQVDMVQHVQQQQQSCSCPQVQQTQISYRQEEACGCNGRSLCQNHYQNIKEKKGFFKTTSGKILTYAAAFAGGYFLRGWIGGGHSPQQGGQIITQGELTPLPRAPIFTQGPLFL